MEIVGFLAHMKFSALAIATVRIETVHYAVHRLAMANSL